MNKNYLYSLINSPFDGLISANKSIKLYEFEPENYSPYSYNNVKNATPQRTLLKEWYG